MPEGKPGEFKTSLMGFKKADVLAYVDELAAKSLAEQQEHEQKAAQLQKELDGLRADNDLLMEKTREVCDKLTGEEKRAVDAETRAKALAEQLLHLEETANTYKNRLFTKEQEAVVLKSDNQRLTELLATRQQEIEAARTQAQQAEQARAQERQQAARRQEELEREQANRLEEERARCARQLESEQQAAQREVELGKAHLAEQARREKQELQQGAQQIADSVLLLRSQLDEVDRKIAQAAQQLQNATRGIYAALGETEGSLEQLGAQVEQFPRCEAPKKEPRPQEPERRRAASGAHRPARRRTLSDGLLELLDRVLKEKSEDSR